MVVVDEGVHTGKRFLKIPCKVAIHPGEERQSTKLKKTKEKYDATIVKKDSAKFLTGRYRAGY